MKGPESNPFSADKSILGFKYQIRYALHRFLQIRSSFGPDVSLAIERLDDIDIEVAGRITNIIQTKDTETVLSNASKPFWSTIRVWCYAIASGRITEADDIKFELIITSNSSDDSFVEKLVDGASADDRQMALIEMRRIAKEKREQKTLGKAYAAFDDLLPQQQRYLVDRIFIRTNNWTLDELDAAIVSINQHGPPGKELAFADVLFGRWERLIEIYLRSGVKNTISWVVLQSLLHEISAEFQEDSLPTSFEGLVDNALRDADSDSRCFIRQLDAIGVTEEEKRTAHKTYVKARQLMSFWERRVLVRPDEVLRHESRLIEEWTQQFHRGGRAGTSQAATPEKQGLQVFDWAMSNAPFQEAMRIRPKCIDPDVVRGTFHELADRPSIGWHPGWHAMFVVSKAEE